VLARAQHPKRIYDEQLRASEEEKMSSNPSERDLQIRTAIDEWEEARIEQELVRKQTDLWQKENIPPRRPKIIDSVVEISDYERESEDWDKPHRAQRARLHEADMRLQRATKKVESLLPHEYEYRHEEKLYKLGSSGLATRSRYDSGRSG
jgi:hypothetical protein